MKNVCMVILAGALVVDVNAAELTFEQIRERHRDQEREMHARRDGKPPSQEQMQARFAKFDREQTQLFEQTLRLARKDPMSTNSARALAWMLEHPRAWYVAPGVLAMDLLLKHHTQFAELGPLVATVGYYLPVEEEPFFAPALELLQRVARSHPDRTVRGNAIYGLALLAKRRFTAADHQASANTERLAREAIREFSELKRNYGDCRNLRRLGIRSATTLGNEAEVELREFAVLRVGALAPEIVGKGLAGGELRLSDHRGKVVLLVFWASWCGPCMAEVPHERELVKRFKERPFVLLGVNGDMDRSAARRAVKQHDIPWRSFWNGAKGPAGPIATNWNVRGWPGVFVLDHLGAIRHKGLRGRHLDEPLERLIRAAEEL